MTAQTPEWKALVVRLERVERQHRRLKVAAAAGALLAGTVFLMGLAGAEPKTVTAEKFAVTDASGRTWAELGYYGKDGPALLLKDGEGTRVVILGASPNGMGALQFRDKTATRLEFACERGGPIGMEFRDKDGKERITLGIKGTGGAELRFRDAQETARVYLGAYPTGEAGLLVRDKEGKDVVRVPAP